METCGMNCIKYLLFAFNFIFALSGVALITVGAFILKDVQDYDHFADKDVLAPPIVLIVTGSVIFLIAFLGCCGAVKESPGLLYAFAVLLIVVFIVELAVGIAAATNKDELSVKVNGTLYQSLKLYSDGKIEREAWDEVQRELECCGIQGPSDWNLGGRLPSSCCTNTESNHDSLCQPTGNQALVYQEGCYPKIKERLRKGSIILMGIGIGIAFLELAGAVLACFLASAIKKEGKGGGDD